jgi:cobalt-zinc-cadmium efflux system outer membrane protein
LLAEDIARAQEDVRTARALVKAGKEADLRAVQADAASAAAQADFEEARADLLNALGRLSSLAGRREPLERVTPSILNRRGAGASNAGDAERSPDPAVRSAEAEHAAAQQRLAVERKRAIPTPTLSIGTRRFSATDTNAWVMSVSVPLPLFDRNRGEIAAARADVAVAEARLSATQLESDAGWRGAVSQAQVSESRRIAADQAEAAAREAYRLARTGYDAGRTPLIELLATRRSLTEAQSRALEARIARMRAEATLARLAGRIPFAE